MLEISTGKNRKSVNIDGYVYLVRKLGAGEQLTLSQAMRELQKLEAIKTPTDEDEGKALDLSLKVMQIMQSCFDDQADGTKSRELINRLDADELQNVLGEIFKDETPEQTPAPAEAKTS